MSFAYSHGSPTSAALRKPPCSSALPRAAFRPLSAAWKPISARGCWNARRAACASQWRANVLTRGRELLVDAEELTSFFAPTESGLTGRLRIDLPYVIAREVVIPRLPEFARAHPQIELAISTTDRRVDLIHEGFDCAMVVGPLPDSDLMVRRLGEMRMINAASPEYLKAYGLPREAADLASHRVVHYAADLSSREASWSRRQPDGTFTRLQMPASLTVNGFDAYQAAAVAGFGLIQAPEVGLRRLIEAGALIPVRPNDIAPPIPVSLLYPGRKRLAPRILAVLDWLASVMHTPEVMC